MRDTYLSCRRTFNTNQIRLPHHPGAPEGFRVARGHPLHPSVCRAELLRQLRAWVMQIFVDVARY